MSQAPAKSREQLLNELEKAENERKYLITQKKNASKAYSEDIKDVDKQINAILDELEQAKRKSLPEPTELK